MPIYANSGKGGLSLNPIVPTVMSPGDDVYVFGTATQTPGQIAAPNDSNVQYETVVAGNRSIAVCLAPRPGGGAPPGMIVQISSNADPGASEMDIMDAAVDADGAYLLPTTSAAYKITAWTAQTGGIWTAWAELQPESGKFVTIKCITNANGVKFTAKISYV